MVLHLPQYRSPPVTQALILVKPPMTLLDLRYFPAAVLWDHHRFLLMWIPPSARPYHDFGDEIATALEMKNVLALKTGIVIVIAVDVVRYPHFLLTLYLSKRDRNFLLHAPQRRQPADPVVGVAAATVLTETVMIVMIMTAPEVHVMFPIAIETVIDIGVASDPARTFLMMRAQVGILSGQSSTQPCLLPGPDDIEAEPRCPTRRNITATTAVTLRSGNIDIEILMLILPHDVAYTIPRHGHRLDDILLLPTLTDGYHTLTAGCTPLRHLMMIHPTILPPVHLLLDVNLAVIAETILPLEITAYSRNATKTSIRSAPTGKPPTSSLRLGIAEMPIHLVPVVSLTPNAGQAWIVRLLAAGRPLVIEIFRTRQEALLASFIIRTLRKSSDQYDISDVLKQLHDNHTVATEGPRDLTIWAYRAQLLQHVADKVAATINDLLPHGEVAAGGRPGLLEQIQRLQQENDQLRLLAAGTGAETLPHPLAEPNPPPDAATRLRDSFSKFERLDRRAVLASNSPKSASTTDVKKWLDGLIKLHRESYTPKLTELQGILKEAASGVLPPLDKTLVDWGLSVTLASKLSEVNQQKLLAMTAVLSAFQPAALLDYHQNLFAYAVAATHPPIDGSPGNSIRQTTRHPDDVMIRDRLAELIDRHTNLFYGFFRVGDNYYHGLFVLTFDIGVISALSATNRHLNDALAIYLLARSMTTVALLPADRSEPPDLLRRRLPLGSEFSSIVRFSSLTYRLGIPSYLTEFDCTEVPRSRLSMPLAPPCRADTFRTPPGADDRVTQAVFGFQAREPLVYRLSGTWAASLVMAEKRTFDAAFEGHLAHVVHQNSTSNSKQPWERSIVNVPSVLPKAFLGRGRLGNVLTHTAAAPVKAPSGPSAINLTATGGKLPRKVGPSWIQRQSDNRHAAVMKWLRIAKEGGDFFGICARVAEDAEAGLPASLQESLGDVFSLKASSTLHSRAGPVLRYMAFCWRIREQPFPLSEQKMYRFVKEYCSGAAPTFASSFMSSIGFMQYVLEAKVPADCVSSRLAGAVSKLYLEKRKLQQKPPLTASQIRALERIVLGLIPEVRTDVDRYAAGCFLYCVFARARYSDMQCSGELAKDIVQGEDGPRGYLEARVTRSKTSHNLERKTRYLAMVSPIWGLEQDSWAMAWMEVAGRAGPAWGPDMPLLPSPTEGGQWQKAPMSAQAGARWLRHLLYRAGEDVALVKAVGTHSCKATLLSWMSKWGASKEIRSILGYHSSANAGTDVIYARDSVSPALRELEEMVSAVAYRRFFPDATRSGMFAESLAARGDAHDKAEVGSDSSSDRSDDEEEPDTLEEEKVVEDSVGDFEPSGCLRESLEGKAVFRHVTTRFIHLVFASDLPAVLSRGEVRDRRRDEYAHGIQGTLCSALQWSQEPGVANAGFDQTERDLILKHVKSLKQLAFVSSFAPGAADEGPLIEALKAMLGKDPEMSQKAAFRAVFHEAYAIVTSEMRQQVERVEEPTVRHLSQPERAERIERQRSQLTGITIKGSSEPSEALVDLCVGQYEANVIQYVPWSKCTSREQELLGDGKKDLKLSIDGESGRLKVENKAKDQVADTSTEVMLLQALQRRALAFDQANIVSFTKLDMWHQKLMKARLTPPPPGYQQVTFTQLQNADSRLFLELQDHTRTGIQSDAKGRPIDGIIDSVSCMHEVVSLMQPLQGGPSSSYGPSEPARLRESPYKGKGKGKDGKGKKRFVAMPSELRGCNSHTAKGHPICYAFNLGSCPNKVTGNKCEKGLHICAVPKCGMNHAAIKCPKKPKDGEQAGHSRAIQEVLKAHPEGDEPLSSAPEGAQAMPFEEQGSNPLDPKVHADSYAEELLSLDRDPTAQELIRLFDMLPQEPLLSKTRDDGAAAFSTGAYVKGPLLGLRSNCSKHPAASKIFAQAVQRAAPGMKFSTLSVFSDLKTEPHVDRFNSPFPNILVPLSNFRKGEVWVESAQGVFPCEVDGVTKRGILIDVASGPKAFYACSHVHATRPWSGRRVVIVGFCIARVQELDVDCRARLAELDFPVPQTPPNFSPDLIEVRGTFHDLRSSQVDEACDALPAQLQAASLLCLDLFCNAGEFGASLKAAGFDVLAIEQPHLKQRALLSVVSLDLRRAASWDFLVKVVLARRVVFVLAAPTVAASSGDLPEGFAQVASELSSFLALLATLDIGWGVLNPLSSRLWATLALPASHVVKFDLLAHGGEQHQQMLLHTNVQTLSALAVPCDESQKPPKTFRSVTSLRDRPRLLCSRFAAQIVVFAGTLGFAVSPDAVKPSANHRSSIAVQRQPKVSKAPPLMPEYKHRVTLQVPSMDALRYDAKNSLTAAFQSVPVGARILQVVPVQGGEGPSGSGFRVTFGVYRTEDEFVRTAVTLSHPFDLSSAVPDEMLEILAFTLTKGPLAVMRHRLDTLTKWKKWSQELRGAEASLHARLHPDVEKIVARKNLTLLRRVAEDLQWPDATIIDDIENGFELVGEAKVTGIFEVDPKPSSMSVDELLDHAKFLKPALWGKVSGDASHPDDQELWDLTCAEADEKGWLHGPYTWEQLQNMFDSKWIPVRRFSIRQKNKLRPIDDLSENAVNQVPTVDTCGRGEGWELQRQALGSRKTEGTQKTSTTPAKIGNMDRQFIGDGISAKVLFSEITFPQPCKTQDGKCSVTGLSNLKDELFTWLDDQQYHVILLQETWLRHDSDFSSRGWICINSGIEQGKRAHAGVQICLRASVFPQQYIRFHHVIPGRVLHVQAKCKGGWVNIINVYQYTWDTAAEQDGLLQRRADVWRAVRKTLGQIPQGNFLLLGGDWNTALPHLPPWTGTGMIKANTDYTDSDCLENLLADFKLLAVNTFGRSAGGGKVGGIFRSSWKFRFGLIVQGDPEIAERYRQALSEALQGIDGYKPQLLNDIMLKVGRDGIRAHFVQLSRHFGIGPLSIVYISKSKNTAGGFVGNGWTSYWQMHRTTDGKLMSPLEEAEALADYWKGVCGGDAKDTPVGSQWSGQQAALLDRTQPVDITRTEVETALRGLQSGKAAPKHCAPHVMWKIAAGPIADHLEDKVLQKWRHEGAVVPRDWPISLIEPAGKMMSGIIKERLTPYLEAWTCRLPFFGYLRWCWEHLVGFADDTHLRWEFSSLTVMHSAMEQAARALALLESMSLVLSREKTVCLLKVEGSQAPHAKKKVIHTRTDGKFLQLSPQYTLPLKKSHIYLGAVISYSDFENMNARHRAHAGHVAFTRLRQYLMARRTLPLHKRLALWKATVAASTLYSITAAGLTQKSFDLIRVQMTKQIRAMANSPRHLTLESDSALLKRLKLLSPADMIESRLLALVSRTSELAQTLHPDDVRIMPLIVDWEAARLQHFRDLRKPRLKQDGDEHVCEECQAVFDSAAALRQHIARLHSKARREAPSEVFDHHRHGTDGMPTCSRCGHRFERWADLNKHIKGNFCQAAPLDMNATMVKEAYLQQARTLPATGRDPRTITLTDALRDELLHHCGICRQWLPNSRYVKIHYTRVHPDYWQQHQAATQNWRRKHIARIKDSCSWCGGTPGAGSVHSDSCPVLFQLTMIDAIVREETGQNAEDSERTAVQPEPMPQPVFANTCGSNMQHGGTHVRKRSRLFAQRGHMDWANPNANTVTNITIIELNMLGFATNYFKKPCTVVSNRTRMTFQEAEMELDSEASNPQSAQEIMDVFGTCLPSVLQLQQEPTNKRAKTNETPTQNSEHTRTMQPRGGQRRGGPQHPQRGNFGGNNSSDKLMSLTLTMARLCLRQEEELQLLRMDKQFLIHFESGPQGLLASFFAIAKKWHEARHKSPPEVANSLRVCMVNSMWLELHSRLERMLKDTTTQNNLHKHGWITKDGEKIMWPYKVWDGQQQQLMIDNSRAPIEHNSMLDIIKKLQTIFLQETENLVHKFRSTRRLTEHIAGTTLPFMMSLSCRGEQADKAHHLCTMISGNSVLQLIGARMRPERAKRQPLADMLAKEMDQMKGAHK
ncbi:unnamed protein product [Symbiodinium sp. CCMP2592]|nr:unnamed protein product [Symbiodinium sp. CCMP2592]